MTIWALSGRRAAVARASSVGVRRSAPPLSMSVGTAGSGPIGTGAGDAVGQPRHRPMSSEPSAVPRSNGAKSAGGRSATIASACRARVLRPAARFQGNESSSHVVAA